jgi:hypothetical protein
VAGQKINKDIIEIRGGAPPLRINPSHAKRCDDMEKFREALKSLIEIVKRESGFNADKAA